MTGKRALLSLAVVLVALAGARFGSAIIGHPSTSAPGAPLAYMPVAGETGEQLDRLQSYWSDRVTYPTGRFNPAWLRKAAAQAARVPRGVPAGHQRPAPAATSADGTATSVAGTARSAAADTTSAASTLTASALSTTSFTSLGPQPERMTGCSGCFDYTRTEGRVNSIVVDPTTTTNGNIVAYAASVGGGVWKTTNCCSSSTTWSATTDDPLISAISIDTLSIDPNDHNTIYAGTGDLNYGSFSMGSQGVLKSTDGGAHWTVLGEDVFGLAYVEPAGQFPQYDAVGKVRVDPNDSSKVVAGTKKGLFLSYDGGANWTGPCLTNNFPTQRQDITGLELSNMGGGATRIVAAVGVRGFASTVQFDLNQSGANGIYSATMPASGCPSFSSIASNSNGFVFGTAVSGSPYATGANLNAGSGSPFVSATSGDQLGRIDIAVAPSNPNVMYAQVQSIAANANNGCGTTSGCQLGVWATTNGGSSWQFMAGSAGGSLRNCLGTSTSSNPGDYPQNWYDQGLAVDPNNADRLFVDTYDVWFATRTGTSLFDLSCGYNGSSAANHVVHTDQHALAFVAGSSSLLLVGSDGGAFGSINANNASSSTRPTFFNMDTGLNTIEFYSGDISGNFASSANPSAAGGAQDNAPSVVGFSGTPTGPAQWQMTVGGDGFYARIDPVGSVAPAGTAPRYWVGNNSGGLSRCAAVQATCLAGGGSYGGRTGGWTADTQSFILPFDLFHGGIPGGDDCGAASSTTGCGHLLAGSTRVWETITGATSTNTWVATNNPSTQNMTKQTLGNRSFINQVKYSPKWQSGGIVGTNDGNVWIGRNLGTGATAGAVWTNVTGGNAVLPNRPVLGIALDPSAPAANVETGYAAVGGFNANTPSTPGHVFRIVCTANCAAFTWTDKTGNLPDIPVDSIIANPNFPQQVYAGTDFGLFYTDDITAASPAWFRFDSGLPHSMIWDLQIDRGSTTLSVWTRGRGAYVWPLPSERVIKLAQTITFDPIPDQPYGTADFDPGATASSGLAVSYSALGNCSIVSNKVHPTGTGSCAVTASQAGDASYSAADDVSQSFDIVKGDQTITFPAITDKTYGVADFAPGATASSGLAVSYSAAGDCSIVSGKVHLTGAGSCTVTASQAGDDNWNAAEGVARTFDIAQAPTSVSVSAASVQYSDPATLTASVTPFDISGDVLTGSVEFFVDGTSVGSAPMDATGVATTTAVITKAPGTYGITASFTSTNSNYTDSAGGPATLTVTKEDARAAYNGNSLYWTSSVNSNSADVTLSAAIRDITAADPTLSPPHPDTYGGDVRNATVTFVNRDLGNAPLTGCSNVPIGLASNDDTETGVATCSTTLSLGNNNSSGGLQFDIGMIVNGYYTRDSSQDDTIVNVALPIPSSFITGAGYLVMSNSSGLLPGTWGSKNNFGFNVKYNKKGTNLQGNVSTIVRSGDHVYHIKGNAISSLGVVDNTANFTGRASIQDVTDPNNVTSVDGNATLQMWMTDNGEPGSLDTLGIQVLNKSGGMWFSSNWIGTTTLQQLLGGGNLSVR